jgi:anaerobic selenocysteine-containing dehydrogenase
MNPAGRAFLKGCEYTPAHEQPSEDFPLLYTTGRTVYQFHTRTKTGRSRALNAAAPDAWVETNPGDADRYGIAEGDLVRVESPSGSIEVTARIGQVMAGAVLAPFHYGPWDPDTLAPPGPERGPSRQANELTMTVWDPVSKQPYFKTAACRIIRLRAGDRPSAAPTTAASAPAPGQPAVPGTRGGAATTSDIIDTPDYPNDPAQRTDDPAPTATLTAEVS